MELIGQATRSNQLEMKNEDHYKKQADFYRNSEEYSKMLSLYPILRTVKDECKEETLIA